MRIALVLLLLLLAPLAIADDSYYNAESMNLQLTLKNTLTITSASSSSDVDYVTADLSWWPRDTYRQLVTQIATIPQADFQGSVYSYSWQHPRTTSLDLQLRALLTTTSEMLPVTRMERFPITSIPDDVARYVKHTDLIDTNDAIREQALDLAAGKSDLFAVVYGVADWVTTNIAYNLTSLNVEATYPSSEVFATRQGVCDEMTALFISMLRDLGIPARFVSGISYTNLPEFASPWGGHGWAEVWFSETGWVPFDVTYGTYGYVDATHIKLKDDVNAGDSSIDFTMRAYKASLMTRSLDTDVKVLSTKEKREEPFTVALAAFDDTALDSYNLVIATIRNRQDHYVSARFQLAQTEGLHLLSPAEQNLLLKPLETKHLYWLVRTEDLQRGFYYDFPVKLYAGLREVGNASFQAKEGLPSYEKEFFDQYLQSNKVVKEYNKEVSFVCESEPEELYVNGTVNVTCKLENGGAQYLRGVEACITDCKRFDLATGEEETFEATFTCDSPGTKVRMATASSQAIEKQALIRYSCNDEAALSIDDIEHPETLGFDEQGEVHFSLERESQSLPENVRIAILHDNFEQAWTAESLSQPQRFTYLLHGSDLDLSGNEVAIVVTYEDALGKEYETRETFTIQPTGLTFMQKTTITLANLQRWLESYLET